MEGGGAVGGARAAAAARRRREASLAAWPASGALWIATSRRSSPGAPLHLDPLPRASSLRGALLIHRRAVSREKPAERIANTQACTRARREGKLPRRRSKRRRRRGGGDGGLVPRAYGTGAAGGGGCATCCCSATLMPRRSSAPRAALPSTKISQSGSRCANKEIDKLRLIQSGQIEFCCCVPHL